MIDPMMAFDSIIGPETEEDLQKLTFLIRKALRKKRMEYMHLSAADLFKTHDECGTTHYKLVQGLIPVRAKGCWIWDITGRKFLDLNGRYSVEMEGYCNLELIAEVTAQMFEFAGAANRIVSVPLIKLEKKVCALTRQDRVIFMNSGAESVDTAIKGAVCWGYETKEIPDGCAEIIYCKGAFHGRTISSTAMLKEKYRHHFGPFPVGRIEVPFGDTAALERAITPNTAVFLVEPIQGEGGIVLPPVGYLQAARELCTRHGLLLIFDEIQCGIGRCGAPFAGNLYGVHPDILCLGKALGQDYPISACAMREDVGRVFVPGSHGSTFGGNPVACAAALVSLKQLEQDDFALVKNADAMGRRFKDGLKKHDITIHGEGLFLAQRTQKGVPSSVLFQNLLEQDIIAGEAGDGDIIRYTPALNVTADEIDWSIPRIVEATRRSGIPVS